VIVADYAGRIHKFTKTGSYIRHVDPGVIADATGLSVSPSGDLVVVDYDRHVAVVRDERVVCEFGVCGKEPYQLNNPHGVAVTKSGQIIVANAANNNLLVYDTVKKIYTT
jgi:DNA-binding beta-propeller fold protein YncE